MEAIETKIGAYLARFFPGHTLGAQEDIFSLGFVNSMFALQLVNFLEHEFEIEIENEDLELDNFRSIDAMRGFVERKRPAESSAKQGG
ncbi:MAG TPA: phosphopantetheine-binding protein [Labilithrix sp.]|nr:phosphopantetheine-binding protein [Labilithrix sp.]